MRRSMPTGPVLLTLALMLGCSGPTASSSNDTSPDTSGGTSGDEAEAPPSASSEIPPAQPLASICAAYLEHYRRCEPVLAPEIAAGNRRSADAEEGWVRYMESSAEAPSLPSFCRDADAELASVCP